MKWCYIILTGAVLVTGVIVVVDCISGQRSSVIAVVTGKYYVPMVSTSESTIPEQWRVTSSDIETGEGFDSEVRRRAFAAITNGQIVEVTFRVGGFSGIRYPSRITQ